MRIAEEHGVTRVTPRFRVGDLVEVINTSLGAGAMSVGDLCVVKKVSTEFLIAVYVLCREDGSIPAWNCLEKDIVPYDATDPDREKKRHQRLWGSFLSSIPAYAEDIRQKLEVEMDEAQNKVASNAMTIRALQKYTSEAAKEAKRLSESKEFYDRLALLVDRSYEKIDFVNGDIRAVTKPITAKAKDMVLTLGKYMFSVNFSKGVSVIDRPSDEEKAEYDRHGRYSHPHISGGKPCLGEFQVPLVNALVDGDYLGILELVHRFLSTVTPGDTYKTPLLWVKDRVDFCNNCKEYMTKCRCGSHARFNPIAHEDILRYGETEKELEKLLKKDAARS